LVGRGEGAFVCFGDDSDEGVDKGAFVDGSDEGTLISLVDITSQ
jgi:hypothetical protein